MTKHSDLIARIEAAEGPSRELDYAIRRATDDVPENYPFTDLQRLCCPAYTSSLDATKKLLPERWDWDLKVRFNGTYPEGLSNVRVCQRETGLEKPVFGRGKTPELALCAAALRAQEASE